MISIITPTYNRSRCITRCMNSVKRQYDVLKYEHIIIDDGSTDDTSSIVNSYDSDNIVYLKHDHNKGVMTARQLGIDNAKGDHVMFLDSDDELTVDAFIEIEKALRYTKNKYMIYMFMTLNNKNEVINDMYNDYINNTFKDVLSGNSYKGESCAVINKKVFNNIKFDRGTMAFEMLFWHEAAKLDSQVNIPAPIRIYHDSKDSLSLDLLSSKNALKRAQDYDTYLEEFCMYYIKFNLVDKVRKLYRRMGLYYAAAGCMIQARYCFIISKSISLSVITRFGKLPFVIGLSLLKYYKSKN